MIGRLKGILLEKQPPHILLDVNGVGYELQASMQTFYQLPEIGQPAVLHTHFVVREDAQQLYAFSKHEERVLFRALLKVNGIGPKIALAILSSIEADDFVQSVIQQNTNALQKLPGIGKKTAERLVIEMRDRLDDWHYSPLVSDKACLTPEQDAIKSPQQEAISALISLGYKPQEARNSISKIIINGLSSQEIIRLALQSMTAV